MLLQDITDQVQYVVDGEGKQSAIQIDIDTWQKVLAQLQSTPSDYDTDNSSLSTIAENKAEIYNNSAVATDEPSNDNDQSLIMEFPANVISALHAPLDELDKEFRKELALVFYQQNRLSVGKARQFSQMTRWEFEKLLGERKIIRHYTEEDLMEDIKYGLGHK